MQKNVSLARMITLVALEMMAKIMLMMVMLMWMVVLVAMFSGIAGDGNCWTSKRLKGQDNLSRNASNGVARKMAA